MSQQWPCRCDEAEEGGLQHHDAGTCTGSNFDLSICKLHERSAAQQQDENWKGPPSAQQVQEDIVEHVARLPYGQR